MRVQWSAILWLSLLTVAARAQAAPGQAAPVPNQEIANIKIGMTPAEVHQRLGKPSGSAAFTRLGQHYLKDYWQRKEIVDYVLFRQGKVIQLDYDVFRSPSPPVTFASIRRQHPHLTITLYDHGGDVGSDLMLDDVAHGYAWEVYIWHDEFAYTQSGAVRVSFDDAQVNWAIRHQPRKPALPDHGDKPIENGLLLHNLRAWFAAGASRG